MQNRNSFYERREWLDLRYRILRKYGWKCMACGRGKDGPGTIHVDHIKPIKQFPELALCEENLQVLCKDCNLGKSANHSDDFRPKQPVATPIPIWRRRYDPTRFANDPEQDRLYRNRIAAIKWARISRRVKSALSKAEDQGNAQRQAGLLAKYMRIQRHMKTLSSVYDEL